MAFTAIYNANVLYTATLRALLVRLGATGLFRARWTEKILDDMVRGILTRRPELEEGQLAALRSLVRKGVADCLVSGYEPLINGLTLPDPADRHVLAAAIRCSAGVIVTENPASFPAEELETFNIEAQSPDRFVLHLLDLAPSRVATVVQQQAMALCNPPSTVDELLDRLGRAGLPRSVAALRGQLGG